jgi:hypothetical protein
MQMTLPNREAKMIRILSYLIVLIVAQTASAGSNPPKVGTKIRIAHAETVKFGTSTCTLGIGIDLIVLESGYTENKLKLDDNQVESARTNCPKNITLSAPKWALDTHRYPWSPGARSLSLFTGSVPSNLMPSNVEAEQATR